MRGGDILLGATYGERGTLPVTGGRWRRCFVLKAVALSQCCASTVTRWRGRGSFVLSHRTGRYANARNPVPPISGIANTVGRLAGSTGIRTRCVTITTPVVGETLINISARIDTIAIETKLTSAIKSPRRIGANGIGMTIVCVGVTLVDVRTRHAVTTVTGVTSTRKSTNTICTGGRTVAVVSACRTLVYIRTAGTASLVTIVTSARKSARRIVTGGISITVIRTNGTFVIIGAALP